MLRLIDLLHRWIGGLVGLVFVVIGLSGALLVHEDLWISGGRQGMARASPASVVANVLRRDKAAPAYIIFASARLPLDRVTFKDDSGAYYDPGGRRVARWNNHWRRPELWLFDLHRSLLMGRTGRTLTGIAGILGLGFLVTGALLWWRRRKVFAPTPWPARLRRPEILRHHRDLGVMTAPLLALSLATGAMMSLKPLSFELLAPWSRGEVAAASALPTIGGGELDRSMDWSRLFAVASDRFPDAEPRVLSFPLRKGGLLELRMRRRREWTPNGATSLWFDPRNGRLVAARDALAAPSAVRMEDAFYPLHAAKVGGLAYRLLMTLSGLSLATLGSLSVWVFWLQRLRSRWGSAPTRAP